MTLTTAKCLPDPIKNPKYLNNAINNKSISNNTSTFISSTFKNYKLIKKIINRMRKTYSDVAHCINSHLDL